MCVWGNAPRQVCTFYENIWSEKTQPLNIKYGPWLNKLHENLFLRLRALFLCKRSHYLCSNCHLSKEKVLGVIAFNTNDVYGVL